MTALRRQPGLWAGVALLTAIVLACVLVPILSPYATDEIAGPPVQGPSSSHWFGTDTVGQDLFTRTFAAGRLDLAIGLIIVLASMAIGTLVGTIAGAATRRWLDTLLMRFLDAILAFPFLILILALVIVFGNDSTFGPLPSGAPAIVLAMLVVGWTVYARLARGQTLALRERDYVVAAQLLGYSQSRIVVRHLLPSVTRVTAAYAVADVIVAIIVTASLSFLGVGIQPPTPEWGALMFEGRSVLATSWWITVFPGVVLALTGLGLMLVADGLMSDRRGRG